MGKSLVLGFFDGIHIAHKAVIKSALDYSDDVVLVTFKNSPALYFGSSFEYILSRQNSIEKIYELNVKEVVELDFPSIAAMPAIKYLEYLIESYNPISISTGFNHTFGANKKGNPDFLKLYEQKYNYKYICVPPVKKDDKIVSSTLIKDYLKKGCVEKANFLLESNFVLEGIVIHGAKIGRTIGFPTANINYPDEIVKLPFGVYKVQCKLSLNDSSKAGYMKGIMNWGLKPTVNNTLVPVVEVHILDFDGDLYKQKIRIEVLKKIRDEKKFGSIDELKAQIKEDIKKCSK